MRFENENDLVPLDKFHGQLENFKIRYPRKYSLVVPLECVHLIFEKKIIIGELQK